MTRRAVVLTTSFPRDEDDPSGHFVQTSARALAREGYEVHVVVPGGSPLAPAFMRGPLCVHPAGGGSLFGWPGAVARARAEPWRLVGAGGFVAGAALRVRSMGPVDKVVAHWIVPSAWPLALSVRAPLDVVAHGADVRLLLALPRALRERVLGHLLGRGARFTFVAARLLESLQGVLPAGVASRLAAASRVAPAPIEVPVVAKRAAQLRDALKLAPSERLVVTAARLVADKRIELAIDAVREARTSARLIVVGDGPARAALERHARASGAAVTFTGMLGRREALAWVASADVLAHTSAVEAAPTVVREARALGTPVIACDAGDLAAWGRDDPGIRIVAPTAAAIGAAIAATPPRACIWPRFE